MDAVAERGRNSVSKLEIQPEWGDEQVDAGGTAEPISRLNGILCTVASHHDNTR